MGRPDGTDEKVDLVDRRWVKGADGERGNGGNGADLVGAGGGGGGRRDDLTHLGVSVAGARAAVAAGYSWRREWL